MKNQSVLDVLEKEHSDLKSILKKAMKCKNSQRKDYLSKIEEELVPHARGEEKTIYSLLNERVTKGSDQKAVDLVNEAYEEHRVVDELMKELKKVDTRSDQWLAHLKVIKENIEHHIEEEENDLFKKLRANFTGEELKDLAGEYLEIKENYQDKLPQQGQIKERTPAVHL